MIVRDIDQNRNIELSAEQATEAFRQAARAAQFAPEGFYTDSELEYLLMLAARDQERQR